MIKYKIVKKPILSKPGEYKYFATSSTAKKVTQKELVKEALEKTFKLDGNSKESSKIPLKITDANLLFDTFFELIGTHLQDGDTVKLNSFGTLSLSIKSEGKDLESEVTPSVIDREKSKVSFRNGTQLKEITQNLKFEKES